jgi:hypothetical protein
MDRIKVNEDSPDSHIPPPRLPIRLRDPLRDPQRHPTPLPLLTLTLALILVRALGVLLEQFVGLGVQLLSHHPIRQKDSNGEEGCMRTSRMTVRWSTFFSFANPGAFCTTYTKC